MRPWPSGWTGNVAGDERLGRLRRRCRGRRRRPTWRTRPRTRRRATARGSRRAGRGRHRRPAGAGTAGQDQAALVVDRVLERPEEEPRPGRPARRSTAAAAPARHPQAPCEAALRIHFVGKYPPPPLQGTPPFPRSAIRRDAWRTGAGPASPARPAPASRGGPPGGGVSPAGGPGRRRPSLAGGRPVPAAASASEPGAVPVEAEQVDERAPGPTGVYAAHWNRAAVRVRRWLMPTTLRPSGVVTSPAPTAAKHTRRPSGPQASARRGPPPAPRPRSASAAGHASPTHRAARPTSSSHSGSPAGTITSTQAVVAGSTHTTPRPTGGARRRSPARATAAVDQVASLRRAEHQRPASAPRAPTPRGPGRRADAAWRSAAGPGAATSGAPPGRAARSRRDLQVRRPRVRARPRARTSASSCLSRRGGRAQPHRRLGEHAVALAHVARAAGGDDVLPRVGSAAPAAGHDVVDALGRAAAVLAAVARRGRTPTGG